MDVLKELSKIQRVDPPNLKVAYSSTAIPEHYAPERRKWSEDAKLPLHPGALEAFPWQRFRWAEAHIHFVRAIGAARTGETSAARLEVERLADIQKTLAEVKGDYDWAKQVKIKHLAAAAWLAHAEGKQDEALRLMRAAADLDDATEKHPVTPGTLIPARELLGDMLIELKQPATALQEFEIVLRNAPNRFNALYGAARAANLAADQKSARTYYQKLVELCRLADSKRPEIEEAKAFLTNLSINPSANAR